LYQRRLGTPHDNINGVENNDQIFESASQAMGKSYGAMPCCQPCSTCGALLCLEGDMSIAYSEYRSVSWGFLKIKGEKPATADDYLMSKSLGMVISAAAAMAKAENNDFYFEDVMIEAWLTRSIKFEKVCHYFLDEGLADFLVSSVKETNEDYFKESVLTTCAKESHVKLPEPQYLPFFLHFPCREKRDSVGVIPYCKLPSVLFPQRYHKYLFAARDNENVVMVSTKHAPVSSDNKHGSDDDTVFLEKLVYGFTLYLDAFPDVIRESDGVKHIGHYKGNRHYIRSNEIVRTEASHSVSPHFRRGHFRVLSSDRFKKARGKTIFINGVFVKGKAYDVLADDYKDGGEL
jgi:hypothetical protein